MHVSQRLMRHESLQRFEPQDEAMRLIQATSLRRCWVLGAAVDMSFC
jgi:hypothetical protein